MSNAPITKVMNTVDRYEPLFVEFENSGTWAKADTVPTETGEQYRVSFYRGMMPAYDSYTFETVQELANFMREQADLRTWKHLYDTDENPRI